MKKKSFDELYRDILRQKISLREPLPPEYDPSQLDCLLHPERYAPVICTGDCGCSGSYERACENSCVFDAIVEDGNQGLRIDPDKCVGCEACIAACENHNLTASRDVLPAMRAVRQKQGQAYALVAPAFFGQFGEDVTPGKLRSAFLALGFSGMVEVALFADILTMKEALEFDRHINSREDFQLTSCCCPVWIAMIRRVYRELIPHVPGAVSPMIAAGRVVKRLHPDAVTVFVGPCMAKKSEARETDIADAVDYVLTFEEMADIFAAADIRPQELPEKKKEHASRAGRIYAHTGGVSEAVAETVRQLRMEDSGQVKAEQVTSGQEKARQVTSRQADGVPACRELLERIQRGELEANFFEGMGCVGGCVGGPKAILPREEGRKNVERYGDAASYRTPLENPFVMKLMERLGFETVEELLEDEELFVRNFD